jgi:hypothetical protein
MSPYLSIVQGIGGVVTEDLIRRLHDSAFNTAALAKNTGADVELVVVEWNMPTVVDLTKDIAWTESLTPIRIIHVPRELHASMDNPNRLRYHEMRPKNIGIRRAHGEFVLSCNPDDLFSEEMFSFFARKNLLHGHFYRANRHDTKDGKVYRVCHATGCYPPEATEEQIRTPQYGAAAWSKDMLHFNGSGDFLLMSKDDWFAIHGNPERPWNHTVDGESVYLAHSKGLKQIVLKHPFYHPNHERTLNISETGKVIAPSWSDAKPHYTENGDSWGYAGMEFKESLL